MNKIICFIFGHKLIKVPGYDRGYAAKLLCKRCNRYFGINHNVKAFVPWDKDLEELYTHYNL